MVPVATGSDNLTKPNRERATLAANRSRGMLDNSGTLRRESLPSYRAAKPGHRDHKRSDECRLKKANRNRLNYTSRKLVGLYSYGHCPAKTEPGQTHCQEHSRAMSERASERRNEWIAI